jgi:hypothetical protein
VIDMVLRAKVIGGRKYMWDGREHAGAAEAGKAAEEYRKAGFEAETVEEGGRHEVYTRKAVKAAPEGQPQ